MHINWIIILVIAGLLYVCCGLVTAAWFTNKFQETDNVMIALYVIAWPLDVILWFGIFPALELLGRCVNAIFLLCNRKKR